MSINNIKGFNKLSELAKSVFIWVYAKHINAVEDKDEWTAVRVKERKDHIEVHFKNGNWLKFYTDGTWC
ncbi:MAG: hypothetical protein RIN55_05760 [Tissierellaceae bacterium]|nr:hypothetical protein [Tissierellaceae bacterium]